MTSALHFPLVVILIVVMGCCRDLSALPLCNGVIFYHTMPCYYRTEPVPTAQKLMYVQYMRPGQGRVRAANEGLSTFVTADAIGAEVGAFIKGAPSQEEQIYETRSSQSAEVTPAADFQGAISVAESYPDEDALTNVHIEDKSIGNLLPELPQYEDVNIIPDEEYDTDRKGKTSKDFIYETTHSDEMMEQAITQKTTLDPSGNSSPLPAVAATYIPPRKKIRVELDAPPSEESNEHPFEPAYKPKAARPSAPTRAPPQNFPSGSFFPINFGGTSGGAIAIANSFSTGEGGSAVSHATAYGSPKKHTI